MQKKILIAAGIFPPDIGGPATYAAMVAKALPQHGIEVEVVPYGLVRHKPKFLRHLSYFWLLCQKIKEVDAVYALDPMSVGLPALLVSRLYGKSFLVRLGGDYAWEQGRQRFGVTATLDEYTENPLTQRWPVRVFAWLQRQVVQRAALVIVPSEYLQSIVTTWRGVDPDRIQVVYSALFPLPAPVDRNAVRAQLEYTGFTLVTGGRLVPWKGVVGILEVVKRLLPIIPDLQLIVFGSGTEEMTLQQTAQQLGISNHVRFAGSLGKETLGTVIGAADVFVYNTAYEGLSHQLLEVMDLKVPIVTTNVGGNPELITDNQTGMMVAFNDIDAFVAKVIALYESPELREQYSLAATKLLPAFDQTVAVERLVETLNKNLYAT